MSFLGYFLGDITDEMIGEFNGKVYRDSCCSMGPTSCCVKVQTPQEIKSQMLIANTYT